MTTPPDQAALRFSPPDPPARRWLVELVGGERRTIEATGWRVEGGALVMLQPVGIVAAYAPGAWRMVEAEAK